MKTKVLLIFSFLFAYSSHAQAPWRAKLIVYFEGPNETLIPDTIWVGCDSAGGEGFQPGLDVLADSIEPYHIYSLDTTLPGKYLRTNIKGFRKGVVTEFKMKCRGNAKFIVWDSLEYNYENDTMFMLYSGIDANEFVSFDASHKSSVTFCLYPYSGNPPWGYYNNDSIEVLEGGWLLEFSLNARFEDSTIFSGLKIIAGDHSFDVSQIGNDAILISSGKSLSADIKVISLTGALVQQASMNGDRCKISTEELHPGLYLLQVTDHESRQQAFKFIKQ